MCGPTWGILGRLFLAWRVKAWFPDDVQVPADRLGFQETSAYTRNDMRGTDCYGMGWQRTWCREAG